MSLLKPFIKIDKAECYDCRIPIRIYDSEAFDIELSSDGFPLNANQLLSKTFGVCPKCGRRYDVERRGVYFNITSDLRKLFFGGQDNGETEFQQVQKTGEITYNEFGYGGPGSR